MATLKTWKDFTGNAGTAITTWNYSPQRGFLISKVYDDSSSVTYSNSFAGRLLTRTWARGIVTTYDYNAAGDLATIDYSDTTPDITHTYDRRGRRTQTVNGAGTHVLTYNDAGQLLTESFPNSGVIVTNTYDALLRRSVLSGTTVPVVYSYDAASRLSVVSNGTHTATYAYHLNSSLVSNILFQTSGVTRMTTSKSYDNLNRLTSISSVPSTSSAVSYSYTYNDANQRTRVDLADGSYWVYQYDELGQVTSGKKYWADGTPVAGQQFEYGFDNIGNRETTDTNGRASTYTANSLNQYTQRTVPGAVDVLGTAASNATVTVNLQPVARQGEYFHNAFPLANATSAVWSQLVVTAVRKNAGTNNLDVVTETGGNAFVPKTPEVYTYDTDGNLTGDGRWIYTWNGENRLISMETSAAVTAVVGTARAKLLFGYDHQGRRISKVVSNWTGSAWAETENLRFVYDGWNLLAELDSTNGVVRSYVWGSDLSGSMQGAGGIGGLLLSIPNPGSPVPDPLFFSYDGNGNVMALVSAADGTIAARYEYGPFGETIRAEGEAAGNRFRFSTKYEDPETGLLYYGYRYYDPSTGRWLNRDPIEEPGGINISGFLHNNPVHGIDLYGLAEVPKEKWACPCDKAEVLKVAGKAARKAADLTAKYPLPGNAVAGSVPPEYCGRVCCNGSTKAVEFTGPIPGIAPNGTWEKKVIGYVGGKPLVVYGYGKVSCDPKGAPDCSTKGEGWVDAAYYHSHPGAATFSPGDKEWVFDKPLLLTSPGSEVIKVLIPFEVVTTVPYGTASIVETREYIVNADGSLTPVEAD